MVFLCSRASGIPETSGDIFVAGLAFLSRSSWGVDFAAMRLQRIVVCEHFVANFATECVRLLTTCQFVCTFHDFSLNVTLASNALWNLGEVDPIADAGDKIFSALEAFVYWRWICQPRFPRDGNSTGLDDGLDKWHPHLRT